MTTIIDMRDMARQLWRRTVEFQDTVVKLDGPRMLEHEAFEQVYHLLDDTVSSRLLWCRTSYAFRDRIEGAHAWFNWRRKDHLTQAYIDQVLDPLMAKVKEIVGNVIPCNTWVVWYARRIGKDLFLFSGDDFRIVDWENRVASGEIPHPTNAAASNEDPKE